MKKQLLKQLNEDLINQHLENNDNDENYGIVENLYNSYYILYDGTFLGCLYDCGSRCDDHRGIFGAVTEEIKERGYDWELLHKTYKLLRFMPEANCIYVAKYQRITKEQKSVINKYNLEVIRY